MRTIHRDIVGAFIFSSDNKLLLGKSYKGGVYPNAWIIPGGGIDDHETRLDALRREVLEEVNLDISGASIEDLNLKLTGTSQKTLRETGETVIVDMTFFNYKITLAQSADETKLEAGDDFTVPQWFSVDQLASLEISPPSITLLKKMGLLKD